MIRNLKDVRMLDTFAELREVGTAQPGAVYFVIGQGFYEWDDTSVAADDGANVIMPGAPFTGAGRPVPRVGRPVQHVGRPVQRVGRPVRRVGRI